MTVSVFLCTDRTEDWLWFVGQSSVESIYLYYVITTKLLLHCHHSLNISTRSGYVRVMSMTPSFFPIFKKSSLNHKSPRGLRYERFLFGQDKQCADFWKRTKKMYSPIEDNERKNKKQQTILTIKCLHQGNINKLTQKTDREGRRKQ